MMLANARSYPAVCLGLFMWSACGDSAAETAGSAGTLAAPPPTLSAGAGNGAATAGTGSRTPAPGAAGSTAAVNLGSAGTAASAGTGVAGTPASAGAGAGTGETALAAGSGASAGSLASTAGVGAPAAGAGGPDAAHEDLGMGDGSDVITIGDSWMNYIVNGGGIEAGLLAASKQRYRTYGVAGTKLLDEVIPNQYESAKRANKDIKTVVMTGGGNDLLLTGMTSAAGCNEGCKSTIDKVGVRLGKLWDEMATDGVQDVVYIEYSKGGSNADSVEYGTSKVRPVCEAAPLRCHFVDSDTIINMMLLDGVHPTADGCTKIGKAVFELMGQEGMRR